MTFKPFDIAMIPFPLTKPFQGQPRPALVLSGGQFHRENKCLILTMITVGESPSQFGDTAITRTEETGLPANCFVRLKLFTIPDHPHIRLIGSLNTVDQQSFSQNYGKLVQLQ